MLIIGCGNRHRGDDGAGILVAERLLELGIEAETRTGETIDLLEAWNGAGDVIVIDAVLSGAPAGTVHVWNEREPLPLFTKSASATTHGLGVAEAIELACVLDRLPRRLQVYGIEGQRFEPGVEISQEVQRAIEEVVQRIIDHERSSTRCADL
ncbi:MAG: hydrogenase maturation protease [Candidatus Acidiferrum sp.]